MKNEITAKRLTQALEMNNMKASELSAKSGITKGSISQYVNGTYAPGNIKAGKMAEVLNVNPLWLMGFDVPPEKEMYKCNPLAYSFRCDYRSQDDYETAKRLIDIVNQLDKSDAIEVLHMAEFKLSQAKYKKGPVESGKVG